LEVSGWQYDEMEALIQNTPGGPEWFAEHVGLKVEAFVMEDLQDIYVFFGPLERLLKWKNANKHKLGEYDRVIHAYEHHKLQGVRAIVKRVYDIDNDRTWYWNNRYRDDVRSTLENIYHLETRNGNTHFEDLPEEEQIRLWTKKRKYEIFWREVPRDQQNEILKQGKTHPAHPEYEETANA
jgi:hypothetical protein